MCLIAFGFALPLFGGIEMYLCIKNIILFE